jgi:hypothetical protein
LDDLLQEFERFLLAVGFALEGHLQFVDEEENNEEILPSEKG